MPARVSTAGFTLGVIVWVSLVACGFASLAVYSNTPGNLGKPPALEDSEGVGRLSRAATPLFRHRLAIGIHPKCPCTRATIAELERLIAKCGPELNITALVFQPAKESDDWHKTGLFASVCNLPQTEVILDTDGHHAHQLQLKTSGAVTLYNEQGVPLFWGGITPARGHEGDNLGSDAILSLVRTGKADRKSCSVYGCLIERPVAMRTEGAHVKAM